MWKLMSFAYWVPPLASQAQSFAHKWELDLELDVVKL